jgi:adenylate kinase family enzyme
MNRVVILGRGASGKSTLAKRLGEITGLPVVELDRIFWQPGLLPTSREEWARAQDQLAANEGWIIDGDLGPLDVVEPRLRVAEMVILLDFSLARCAWRAMRRSHERLDFWWWVLAYRWQSRPALLKTIANCAPTAELYIFRSPKALKRFVDELAENLSW